MYYFSFLKRVTLGKEKAIYLISRSRSASKVNQLALGEKTRRRNDRLSLRADVWETKRRQA